VLRKAKKNWDAMKGKKLESFEGKIGGKDLSASVWEEKESGTFRKQK